MCRQPIVENGDDECHYQNRQAVEYAGEPIHRDCHPTDMPEPETNHVAVHEHLLSAKRELAAAVNECDDTPAIYDVKSDVSELVARYEEANLD